MSRPDQGQTHYHLEETIDPDKPWAPDQPPKEYETHDEALRAFATLKSFIGTSRSHKWYIVQHYDPLLAATVPSHQGVGTDG